MSEPKYNVKEIVLEGISAVQVTLDRPYSESIGIELKVKLDDETYDDIELIFTPGVVLQIYVLSDEVQAIKTLHREMKDPNLITKLQEV